MNKDRRKKIGTAIDYLQYAYDIVDSTRDEEQECLDNIPESFEGTDRYIKIEDAIDDMDEALDSISSAIEELESVIE